MTTHPHLVQPFDPDEITDEPTIEGTVIEMRIRNNLQQILIEGEAPTEPHWHQGRVWFAIAESTVIERELPDGSMVPIRQDEIEIGDSSKAWDDGDLVLTSDPPMARAAKIVILPE